jgi:hypothetical protein
MQNNPDLNLLRQRFESAKRVKRGTETKLSHAQSADNNAARELAEARKVYEQALGAQIAEASRV